MAREKNLCGKRRDVENPYEIWTSGDFEYRVLKKYKAPRAEAKDQYARWFVATKSPYTHGSWELGDTYALDIKNNATLTYSEELELSRIETVIDVEAEIEVEAEERKKAKQKSAEAIMSKVEVIGADDETAKAIYDTLEQMLGE